MYTLNPIPSATSFIHLQCIPVSNTTGDALSWVARNFASPSFEVGIVVSMTIFGLMPCLAMTHTFVVRSLTSMPIVV